MNGRQVNTFNEQARKAWLSTVGLLLALSAVACTAQSRPRSQASEQSAANRSADPVIEVSPADTESISDDPCSEMFSNLFVAIDSISYNEYEIVRLHKTVYDKPMRLELPVSYAVLRSGGRTIATFEGVYSGAGNGTDFGLASLLGGETKQLVVSQRIPRNGRHWVVDLSSDGAIVFDSQEWDLGQEDVCVHDFDGVAELSLVIGRFCGIGAMSTVECPMIGVAFKYDSQARKYVPDGMAFAQVLDGIEEEVEKIDPASQTQGGLTGSYLAKRLDIFLRYVYAGRESDGWSFFERTYNLTDKQDVKREIKRILDTELVYRFIYRMQPLRPHSLSSDGHS